MSQQKSGFVYIMTNSAKSVLYIGVTSDLCRRIKEHKNQHAKNSFTLKYNVKNCIYYEEFPCMELAIKREKELKKWSRKKKTLLIDSKNPDWKVLATENGFMHEKKLFAQEVAEILKIKDQNQGTLRQESEDSSRWSE